MADSGESGEYCAEAQSAFADGLLRLFKPAVEDLDAKVINVR